VYPRGWKGLRQNKLNRQGQSHLTCTHSHGARPPPSTTAHDASRASLKNSRHCHSFVAENEHYQLPQPLQSTRNSRSVVANAYVSGCGFDAAGESNPRPLPPLPFRYKRRSSAPILKHQPSAALIFSSPCVLMHTIVNWTLSATLSTSKHLPLAESSPDRRSRSSSPPRE